MRIMNGDEDPLASDRVAKTITRGISPVDIIPQICEAADKAGDGTMLELYLEAREERSSSTQAAEDQGHDEGKKQSAKKGGKK